MRMSSIEYNYIALRILHVYRLYSPKDTMVRSIWNSPRWYALIRRLVRRSGWRSTVRTSRRGPSPSC